MVDPQGKPTFDTYIDAQVRIVATTFDKANAYTNLIIAAGYAGFFALWNGTRGYLSKRLALWAALLMLVSIVSFVVFEIWKMLISSRAMNRLADLMTDGQPRSPEQVLAALQEHEKRARRESISLVKFWRPQFAFTMLTGFAAIGLLLAAFVQALWSEPVGTIPGTVTQEAPRSSTQPKR
jgi:hypothetical protein